MNWRWYPDQDARVLYGGKFCQLHLLCPNCAHRRASRQGARVHEKLTHLADTFDFWFVTLTVKNGPDLGERFKHLVKSFRTLRERARDHRRGKGAYVEIARAAGLVWAFEFTHSEEKGWHPHVHMIAALPKRSEPIRYGVHPVTGEISQLRKDWHDVTGDSIITHAEPLDMGNPHKSVCELVKYSLKFADLAIPDTFEAYQTLRGRKLFECSGALRGVEVPEDDDLLDDLLTGQYFDFLYLWHGEAYTLIGAPSIPEEILLESLQRNSGSARGEPQDSIAQGQHHAGDL
jgi:hypothetical protein